MNADPKNKSARSARLRVASWAEFRADLGALFGASLAFARCLCMTVTTLMVADTLAAAVSTTPEANAKSEDFTAGKKAIDEKRWSAAIEAFSKVVASGSQSADAHNYLGYAYRWQNLMPESLAAYRKALEIDPKHLGANEYLGQAYLRMDNKEQALVQLTRLKEICGACRESDDLASAINAASLNLSTTPK